MQPDRSAGAGVSPAPATPPPPLVVALFGPAGTGKSHRASVVANEVGAEVILDDGLLVAKGKILAGKSAKRESTRVAAIRRALLEDPEHASEIRRTLLDLAPDVLLVIGISENMIRRVTENLGLAPPSRFLTIEEFASPRQMRKARQIRTREGKHVIPAPTLEVRKSFPGYAVDPLRVFVRVKEERPAPGQFVEKSVVRPTWSSLGRFYIEDIVLAAIAARAAVEADGVVRILQVKVDTPAAAAVHFELAISVEYGRYLPDVAEAVRDKVRTIVEHMTGLTCGAISVRVGGVAPPATGA